MAFPVTATPTPAGSANPNPAYSGVFIPEIWSTRLIDKFYDATVLAQIANTWYEGEIKSMGDKVIIRQRPTLTIRSYEANQAITLERPSAPRVELLIDKGLYFAAILDDVMRIQSDIRLLDEWSTDASMQLKTAIDTAVLATIPAGLDPLNTGNAAGRVSGLYKLGAAGAPVFLPQAKADEAQEVNVMDLIVDMGSVLDEQNIPETGRWLVAPSWFCGLLQKTENFQDASKMGDAVSVFRNGKIGMVDRFTVYRSNLLPKATEGTATAFWVLGGHETGLTFASQLSEVETLRMESTFGTQIRGLQVYGSKVTTPTALTGAYAVYGENPAA